MVAVRHRVVKFILTDTRQLSVGEICIERIIFLNLKKVVLSFFAPVLLNLAIWPQNEFHLVFLTLLSSAVIY